VRRIAAVTLTIIVAACQLFRLPALIDVVRNEAPLTGSLQYPPAHVVFAPLTLLADHLNGGNRAELIGFFAWTLLVYAAARLMGPRLSRWREVYAAAALAAGLAAFSAWLVYAPRSIPRFDAGGPDALVFDTHTHSAASRDGRPGFNVAANAAWHQRAGFHAAFLTDHNVYGAAPQWRLERDSSAVRMLDGEELSLRGLHLIVLGNTSRISNAPWNDHWDSTLALIGMLARSPDRPYLIASLPEYYRYHWGEDISRLVAAGVEGFEIWTTSPKGMEIPDSARREVVERAVLQGNRLFGATDMHGIGHTATVWNVIVLPGWQAMTDSAITASLIGAFRSGTGHHTVIARRRYLPHSKAGSLLAIPLGILTVLRTASIPHALSLIAWIWIVSLLMNRPRH